MAIVAAGMHAAGIDARVRQRRALMDRQRVHVGADADAARALATLQRPDHAGPAHATRDREAPRFQQAGNQAGSADLVKSKFGILVDVAPDRLEFGAAVQGVGQPAVAALECGTEVGLDLGGVL
ncbi:hypothetical protein D3C72_1930750 [compost metagenome]